MARFRKDLSDLISDEDEEGGFLRENSDSDDDVDIVVEGKQKERKKKTGRKPQWCENVVNDMFDIILENETFTRKILVENTKKVRNAVYISNVLKELKDRHPDEEIGYDINQTRTKIKRCLKTCRDAAMKIKTASGITRFQEERNLGTWFQKLMPVVMAAPNSQPEQAVELETAENDEVVEDTYVPIKRSKTSKNSLLESSLKRICTAVDSLTEHLENETNQTEKMIKLIKEDAERQEKRDEQFLAMMSKFLEPTPRNPSANNFYTNMLRDTEQGMSSSQMWQMNPRYENL